MTFGSSFWKKRVSVSTYFDVFSNLILQWLHKICDRESRQDSWFEKPPCHQSSSQLTWFLMWNQELKQIDQLIEISQCLPSCVKNTRNMFPIESSTFFSKVAISSWDFQWESGAKIEWLVGKKLPEPAYFLCDPEPFPVLFCLNIFI